MTDLHLKLQAKFENSILSVHNEHGDETVEIRKEALWKVSGFIKEDPEWQMNVLMDLTAVDGLTLKWTPRFKLVYHFYSTEKNHRLRIKVPIEIDGEVDSLTALWPIANWFERECWDMFGVKFRGHPNLKRILLYEEFEGHPLRKDYPIDKRQPLIGPKN